LPKLPVALRTRRRGIPHGLPDMRCAASTITSAQHVLGYRLHTGIDGADSLPMAAAAALAIPHPADRL
jgi:hypothetical protein